MSTKSDIALSKLVFMNNRKLPGVQAVSIVYDVNKVTSRVIIEMVVKKGSIKTVNNKICFETIGNEK